MTLFRNLLHVFLISLPLGLNSCSPTLDPAGSNFFEPSLESNKIIQADGTALPIRAWIPKGEIRAVIVALHGFNDYSRAFEKPAAYMKERGIATYAYDQRGFGGNQKTGIWPGHDTLIGDATTCIELVRALHPNKRLFLLGESMGGAVALLTLAKIKKPLDGLILVGPALRGRKHLGPFLSGILWIAAHTIPWFPLSGEGLEIQASDNITMLKELQKDPLVLKAARVDAIKGLVDLMDDAIKSGPSISTRTLLLYGLNDELIPRHATLEVSKLINYGTNFKSIPYKHGWHMLLRDLNSAIVLKDLLDWIDMVVTLVPSSYSIQNVNYPQF